MYSGNISKKLDLAMCLREKLYKQNVIFLLFPQNAILKNVSHIEVAYLQTGSVTLSVAY